MKLSKDLAKFIIIEKYNLLLFRYDKFFQNKKFNVIWYLLKVTLVPNNFNSEEMIIILRTTNLNLLGSCVIFNYVYYF